MEEKSFFEKLHLKYVTPILAIITALYSFFINVSKDELDSETKRITNQQILSETKIKEQEFQNELRIAVYKEVKEALAQTNNPKFQEATLLMVNSMLNNDSIFREKLTTLILSNVQSKELIKTQEKIDAFEKTAAVQLPAAKYTIDVFYLEDIISESESRAKKTKAALETAFKNKGYNIRLRLLPKFVNAKGGYRIDSNQIRYEKSETDLAVEIQKVINNSSIFEKEMPQLHLAKNKTPNYISIFVRNM